MGMEFCLVVMKKSFTNWVMLDVFCGEGDCARGEDECFYSKSHKFCLAPIVNR